MFDAAFFRDVMGHYPTGVCVVTSTDGRGAPLGMSVGTFTSVSLDPPLVAFLPKKGSRTWAQIERRGRFCVNVLGARQQHLSRRFAAPSEDRFAGVAYRPSRLGCPVLAGVVAWIDCRLDAVHAAGDHLIVVGAVEALDAEGAGEPLVYHRGAYNQPAPLPLEAAAAS